MKNIGVLAMMVLVAALSVGRPALADCDRSAGNGASPECVIQIPKSLTDERVLATLAFAPARRVVFDASGDGQLVYVVTAGAGAGGTVDQDTRLHIYDVTTPRQPREVSSTALGDIGGDHLAIRDGVAFVIRGGNAVEPNGSHFVIVDVHDPSVPKIAGRFDYPFQLAKVSPDGKTVALAPIQLNDATIFVDVSDVQSPKKLKAPPADLTPFAPKHPLDWYNDPAIVGGPKLLGWPMAIVSRARDDNSTLVLFSVVIPTFDAAELRKVYRATSDEYRACLSRQQVACQIDPARLEFAGIRRLEGPLPGGISEAERILMLNDYGFWLSRTNASARAVPILETVVHFEPRRAVAWLNLGDAALSAMKEVDSEKDKDRYWSTAHAAYTRYAALTGKGAEGMATIRSFDYPKVRQSSTGICAFVAAAFNAGGEKVIAASRGEVQLEGKLVQIFIGSRGASCTNPVVQVEGDEAWRGRDELQPNGPPEDISGPYSGRDAIYIVPFRGKSYTVSVVDNGPYDVLSPSGDHQCSFSRKFTPTLVENLSPAICRDFLQSRHGTEIEWTSPEDDNVPADQLNERSGAATRGSYDGVASVDLAGTGKPLRILHNIYESGAGCGCEQGSVELVPGQWKDDAAMNQSLARAENTPWRRQWAVCRGEDAKLIRINGRDYIEEFSGTYEQSDRPQSRMLVDLADGAFRRVCDLEQVPHYTGIPTDR